MEDHASISAEVAELTFRFLKEKPPVLYEVEVIVGSLSDAPGADLE